MFVNSVIISECHSEDGASQVIERRCTVDVEAPRLLKRVYIFFFCSKCHINAKFHHLLYLKMLNYLDFKWMDKNDYFCSEEETKSYGFGTKC